ncbi:nicotinamide riboside transporter PnuC [Flectobacillus sp. DC10W]|uniref:Nicotinamide riboside transporter PnuC n=1 Tax=Flectobacillus longus TaxID=2984207 RepID=A0ABT6YRP3_9BACT|nr:nicotinamide riboside transporter PnuC [Flectobacillus longus]MDI9866249.1 nicotinamide riboside transporter PnuC [Flectobacillus longus]
MIDNIIDYIQTNWLEVFGIVTTLICVWLNIRQNIWGWFWAVVSSSVYGVVYFQSKLYSDMELQIVFIVLSVYGWYQWLFGGADKTELPASKMPVKYIPICIVVGLAFTGISGYLHSQTDASLPYLDASLTAVSLIAQWMMARKYLENWLLWIAANLVYIGMYYTKDLYGTSILYALLLIMAIKGYFDWKKTISSPAESSLHN